MKSPVVVIVGSVAFFVGTLVGAFAGGPQAPPPRAQPALPPVDECICGEVRQCISDGAPLYQQCVGDPRRRVSRWSRCLTAEGTEP